MIPTYKHIRVLQRLLPKESPIVCICSATPLLSRVSLSPLLSSQTQFPVSLGNLQPKSNSHSSMYQSNKKKRLWKEEKERLLNMTRDERRKEYREYVSLDKIPSLMEELKSKASSDDESPEEIQVKNSLCEKVSFYKGDITQLEVDAIVNAGESRTLPIYIS
ncbi:hypothetical protein XELAEV_18026459mg [Xenopus laevis]|uniref:Macro domain-containing protein n=1 Tax=Xenopus laevis TaxID=8355 RepID=A0A974HJD2_XENLA|nr:hypothetical protein XELAEV_18026459mg [Xenopus laevis]